MRAISVLLVAFLVVGLAVGIGIGYFLGAFVVPAAPAQPTEPIRLVVALTAGFTDFYKKDVIEKFDAEREDVEILTMTLGKDELYSRLRAERDAGLFERNSTSIHLIIVGYPDAAALKREELIIELIPRYRERLPNLDNVLPLARDVIEDFRYGTVTHIGYAGQVFLYRSDFVMDPPETFDELINWIKDNPGRFGYGTPPYSGPGTAWLLSVANRFGELNKDPEGWTQTWELLKEIEEYVWPVHPKGTGPVIKAFAGGEVWIMPMFLDWGARLIALGEVPPDSKMIHIRELGIFGEPHLGVIARGVPQERVDVALELLNYLMSGEAQANELKYFSLGITVGAWDEAPEDLRNKVSDIIGLTTYDLTRINMWTAPPPEMVLKATELWREIVLEE